MKAMKLLLLVSVTAMMTFAVEAAQSAKAVVSDGGATLTFVYDDQTPVGMQGTHWFYVSEAGAETFDPYRDYVPWSGCAGTVTKVVFDKTFKDYRPRQLGCWFSDFKRLATIDGISNLDTVLAKRFTYMFSDCESLTSLDLSHFNTAGATDMYAMFDGCRRLKTIVASVGFVTTQVTKSGYMFRSCTALVGGNNTLFDETKTDKTYARIDMLGLRGYFTRACSAKAVVTEGRKTLRFVYDNQDDNYGVKGEHWFAVAEAETIDPYSGNVPWHAVCSSITKVAFDSSFADYRPVRCARWFSGFSRLASVDGLTNLKTAEATDFAFMFANCTSLAKLDLSGLDTRNLTTMQSMFAGCYSLSSLNVTGFDTAKVKNLRFAFSDCRSLVSLDLSSFDTALVLGMDSMFAKCSALRSIVVNDGFVTTAAYSSDMMFDGCTALMGGAGTTYDGAKVDKAYARIDGGPSAPGYFTRWTQPEPEPDPQAMPTLFDAFAAGPLNPKGATYNGFLGAEPLGGTFKLVVKKPKKGSTVAVATLTKVDPATGKRVKVKGKVDVKTGLGTEGLAGLQLNAKGVGGSLGGLAAQGAVDGAKAKDDAALAVMNGFNTKAYGLVFRDAAGSSAYLTAIFQAKGKVKVAGTCRGAKVSGKAQLSVGDRCAVPFVWSKRGVKVAFVLWFDKTKNTLVDVTGLGKGATLVDMGSAAAPANGTYWAVLVADDVVASVPLAIAATPLKTAAEFDGRKFAAGKAAKVSYKKGVLAVDTVKGPNVSGLKLAYSKGALKGSFTVYSLSGGRLVKSRFKVAGVMVDGVGYAAGTNKKLKAIPLMLTK